MIVQVNESYIKYGSTKPSLCPIALAIKDTFGTNDVSVLTDKAYINGKKYKLPSNARLFIQHFDAIYRPNPKPFKFMVGVPIIQTIYNSFNKVTYEC